jgi:glutamate-ammonia-ligase adenylyltransferase
VTSGRLVRLGFCEAPRAASILTGEPTAGVVTGAGIDAFARAADPDLALLSLSRVLESSGSADLVEHLVADQQSLVDLIEVLGVSEALADHLVRHPTGWIDLRRDPPDLSGGELRTYLLTAVGADADDATPTAAGHSSDQLVALRSSYRQVLLQIAIRDVVFEEPMEETATYLTNAADAVLEAALAIARSQVGESSKECRLAVIAMGKCGGEELNYISDVDVIYVVESTTGDDAEAVRVGTKLASALMSACMESTIEGSIWEVDPALRPEGKSGALVRTLESHVGYYQRWAQTWEFQALLKARAAAGDKELGERYVAAVSEFVWEAAGRDHFVEDVQEMRRKVERSISGRKSARDLKLAPGGLRDVEFSVQLLQLVHGRSDGRLRSASTLTALDALASYGYVGRSDAGGMASAYRFLRTLEHRIQIHRLRRTHVLPESEADLRRIARSMGMRTDPVAELNQQWSVHARDARRLHEKLFYRPLLNAVARLDGGELRLSEAAAGDRMRALGFADPESALRHLESLSSGISRRSAIQRTLLPVMLSWFSASPNPDAALLGFRKVSDELGSTPWYLRLLRDESVVAERLADILGSSRYASNLLLSAPEAVAMLSDSDDVVPRSRLSLEAEALAVVDRHETPETAVKAVRGLRRRELFRISAGDSLRLSSTEDVAQGLSDLVSATLAGALHASVKAVTGPYEQDRGIRFLIVAMGRLGGAELGYASDADIMFVFEPTGLLSPEESASQALAIAKEITRLLSVHSVDPPLEIDADLRPEGRSGPLVRSLESYRSYYSRWSQAWESQALLRATPACGDRSMAERFQVMIDPIRYPQGGLSAANLQQMRRLKARMESERLPRGVEPHSHTKMGPGGLSDVEWSAQLLQLQNAYRVPALRVTQTLPALRAARDADLLGETDAAALTEAWLMATKVRNASMLVTGRASDEFPKQTRTLSAVAHLLGYDQNQGQVLLDDYLRATRRCRKVVERVFYGED